MEIRRSTRTRTFVAAYHEERLDEEDSEEEEEEEDDYPTSRPPRASKKPRVAEEVSRATESIDDDDSSNRDDDDTTKSSNDDSISIDEGLTDDTEEGPDSENDVACFDFCFGVEDEEQVEDSTGYDKYIMQPFANPAARRVAMPFCRAALAVFRKHCLVIEPRGCFNVDLKRIPLTKSAAVYAIFKDLQFVEKIGSTGCEKNRFDPHYVAKGVTRDQFHTILKLYGLDDDVEKDVNTVYHPFMTTMCTDESLPPMLRAMFDLLYNQHGDCFGPKRQIFLQLVECALQEELGLPSPMEFLMFDIEKYQDSWDEAVREKDAILDAMAPLVQFLENNPDADCYSGALSGWATGFLEKVSCKIEVTERMVGTNWCDALPEPVFPNATNAADGFSTAYSPEALEEGCKVIHEKLDEVLAHEYGFLYVDTNNLLKKAEGFQSIHEVLLGRGFRLNRESPNKETFVYESPHSDLLYAVVHYPFCFAGDSRPKVSASARFRRGMTVTTLTMVADELHRKPPLTINEPKGNPHFAMHAFQITKTGYHQFLQISTLFYKHIVSTTINVFATTKQRHLPFRKDVPISRRVRHPIDPRKTTNRTAAVLLMTKARSLISRLQELSPKATLELWQQLEKLFGFCVSDKTKCARWTSFRKNHIIPGSRLDVELFKVRDANMNNTGNRTKNRWVHNMAENNEERDDEVHTIIERHAPVRAGWDGSLFWLWFGNVDDDDKPKAGSVTTFGSFVFPGNYHIYTTMDWSALKVKLRHHPDLSLTCVNLAWRQPVIVEPEIPRRNNESKQVGWKLAFLYRKRPDENIRPSNRLHPHVNLLTVDDEDEGDSE